MKFKHGDKVKIIQRKPENTTGSVDYNKPNGDVGKVCYLRTYNNKFQLTGNKNGTGYYYGMYDNSNDACFQDDDLELVSDEFVLPEKK